MPGRAITIDSTGASKRSSGKASAKSSGGTDTKKMIMIGAACVCLVGAGVLTAMNLGLFGGGSDDVVVTPLPGPTVEEIIEKRPDGARIKRELEIQTEQAKNAPKAGS